jgi:hypothetical protein
MRVRSGLRSWRVRSLPCPVHALNCVGFGTYQLEGQVHGTRLIVGRWNHRRAIPLVLPILPLGPSMGRGR